MVTYNYIQALNTHLGCIIYTSESVTLKNIDHNFSFDILIVWEASYDFISFPDLVKFWSIINKDNKNLGK